MDEPQGTDNLAQAKRRIGFLRGEISVPDDFDRMAAEEIQVLFEGTLPEENTDR